MVREIEFIFFALGQMPFGMRVGFISSVIMLLLGIYIVNISPLIFNYYLIPRIEKKIGRKLIPHPLLKNIAFGKWMFHQNEIAVYLINRYYAFKFKGDRGLPKYCNRFDLKKAGYTIDMASRAEIFFSFLWLFSIVVVCICAVIVLATAGKTNFH